MAAAGVATSGMTIVTDHAVATRAVVEMEAADTEEVSDLFVIKKEKGKKSRFLKSSTRALKCLVLYFMCSKANPNWYEATYHSLLVL